MPLEPLPLALALARVFPQVPPGVCLWTRAEDGPSPCLACARPAASHPLGQTFSATRLRREPGPAPDAAHPASVTAQASALVCGIHSPCIHFCKRELGALKAPFCGRVITGVLAPQVRCWRK